MDTEDQATCVQFTTPEMAARCVRDISDIERANAHASGPLSDRLMKEVLAAVRAGASSPWMVGEAQGNIILTHQDWKSSSNITRDDAWLELSERAEDDNDHSWIAAATAAGPTRMGFELRFRKGLPHLASVLSSNAALGKRLAELGFEALDAGEAVYLPVTIETEALANAFANDAFKEALTPVDAALAQIVTAKTELDKLIALVRKRPAAR